MKTGVLQIAPFAKVPLHASSRIPGLEELARAFIALVVAANPNHAPDATRTPSPLESTVLLVLT